MAASHLVKVKLNGDLRMLEVPSPPRFDALVQATSTAYSLTEHAGMMFTYEDADGDQVRPLAVPGEDVSSPDSGSVCV